MLNLLRRALALVLAVNIALVGGLSGADARMTFDPNGTGKLYIPSLRLSNANVGTVAATYLGQAATPTYEPALSITANQSMSTSYHAAKANMANPRLYFANWLGTNESATSLGEVTHTASIEYPIGTTPRQLAWGGSGAYTGVAPPGTLTPAAYVPGGLAIPAGANFKVRVWRNAPGGKLAINATLGRYAGFDKFTSGTTVPDQTGTISANETVVDANNGQWFGPIVILDDISQPSVLLANDSITAGYNDAPDTALAVGPWARAAALSSYGVANLSIAGRSLVNATTTGSFENKRFLAQFFSHAILALGANDHAVVGMTNATMQANALATRSGLLGSVPSVFIATTTPYTANYSNTDVTTQTAPTSNVTFSASGVRQVDNDWRRSVPSGFAGAIELADFFEFARNDGRWKINGPYTDSGALHPVQPYISNFAASSALTQAQITASYTRPTQTIPATGTGFTDPTTGGTWTPAQITSANILWWHEPIAPSQRQMLNSDVASVADKGPNNRRLTPLGNRRPTLVANAFGTLSAPDLTGSKNLPSASFARAGTLPLTIVILFKTTATIPANSILFEGSGTASGNNQFAFYAQISGKPSLYGGTGGAIVPVEPTVFAPNTVYLSYAEYNGAASRHGLNGATPHTLSGSPGTLGIATGISYGPATGSNAATNFPAIEGFSMGLDAPLSDFDRQHLEGYVTALAKQQSILVTGHPYQSVAP